MTLNMIIFLFFDNYDYYLNSYCIDIYTYLSTIVVFINENREKYKIQKRR